MRPGRLIPILGLVLVVDLVVACSSAPPAPAAGKPAEPKALADGNDVLGTRPPEWEATHWLNSPPLTLASLRGKVVLVRWWTSGCPYCSTTAPALRDFAREYADRGLVVVGMYHHKDDGPLDLSVVDRTSAKYGFTFPVAVDPEWRTLNRWWEPSAKQRRFTSVSFLLDRQGVVRHVHPGGEYAKGEQSYEDMRAAIERLLAPGG
ncbi:MAG: hypothetical protein JWP97_3978 [Labilithrix sp.]|nr:hypothetical protein [Labilithrix sp.]